MPRSIHEYVVESLKGIDLEPVFQKTRIPTSTLKKIRTGEIENPGVKGIETLFHYFKALEGKQLRRRAA